MKKEDLKTGQIVELSDGDTYIVLRDDYDNEDSFCDVKTGGSKCFVGVFDTEIISVKEYGTIGNTIDNIIRGTIDSPTTPTGSKITPEVIYQKQPQIEVTVKINGKEAKLSDISEETWLKIMSIN